jgi:hypothetical protein
LKPSSPYILISRVNALPGKLSILTEQIAAHDAASANKHATFTAVDTDTVLELTALDKLSQLDEILAARVAMEKSVQHLLACDWRHEVREHIEDVVPGKNCLSDSAMIELRTIEVKPTAYKEYRQWRQRTIYEAVKDREEIDDFRAYHSVLSTEPGVLFLVGFSCDPDKYRLVYDNDRYRAILREAGDRYIVQGLGGLQTTMFRRVAVEQTEQRVSA